MATAAACILPYDTSRRSITVYRYHGSEAKAFTSLSAKAETPVDGTYYVDTTNELLYIYASGFSTYAVGYSKNTGSTGSTVRPISITSDLTKITKVTVDGVVVDPSNYDVVGGMVTLKASYVATLTNGTHIVKLYDGLKVATGTFTVTGNSAVQSAKTGDMGIALYGAMTIASLLGTGYVSSKRREDF